MQRTLSGLLTLSLFLCAQSATAQVRIAATTDVPVMQGLGLDVEGPGRLRVAGNYGFLPRAYVGLANSLLRPALEDQGYTPEVASAVKTTIERSSVLRATLGWRPFEAAGFVVGAGYTRMKIGGEVDGDDALAGASSLQALGVDLSPYAYDISASLDLVHAEIGWTWTLPSSVWLRTGVGMGFTVGARTEVSPQFTLQDAQTAAVVRKYEDATETYIASILKGYAHPPHVSLAVGWEF